MCPSNSGIRFADSRSSRHRAISNNRLSSKLPSSSKAIASGPAAVEGRLRIAFGSSTIALTSGGERLSIDGRKVTGLSLYSLHRPAVIATARKFASPMAEPRCRGRRSDRDYGLPRLVGMAVARECSISSYFVSCSRITSNSFRRSALVFG